MKFDCNTLLAFQTSIKPLISLVKKEWAGWHQWRGMGKVNHPGILTKPSRPLSWRSWRRNILPITPQPIRLTGSHNQPKTQPPWSTYWPAFTGVAAAAGALFWGVCFACCTFLAFLHLFYISHWRLLCLLLDDFAIGFPSPSRFFPAAPPWRPLFWNNADNCFSWAFIFSISFSVSVWSWAQDSLSALVPLEFASPSWWASLWS